MLSVLWIASFELPAISVNNGNIPSETGGWISSLAENISNLSDINLFICCPSNSNDNIMINGVQYFTFNHKNNVIQNEIRKIIDRCNPDILQVWGAEVACSLPAVQAYAKPERTIIHIQGCATRCVKHFNAGLPKQIIHGANIGEIIRYNWIDAQKKRLLIRAENERKVMSMTGNVFGRTEFDRDFCLETAPQANYYSCGEILREPFYKKHKLDIGSGHRIFFSQGGNHLKGFHILIDAAAQLVSKYPDIEIAVAGNNIYKPNKRKLGDKAYWRYIRNRIDNYGLRDNVKFLGMLNADGMVEEMIASDVFVSASACENSPNSVCEAMMVGLPVIASYVGGIPSLIDHGREGFLYPFDAEYLLAYYIDELFSNKEKAEKIAENAKLKVNDLCNVQKIRETVVNTYFSILDKDSALRKKL